jgi:hypothetical protein
MLAGLLVIPLLLVLFMPKVEMVVMKKPSVP